MLKDKVALVTGASRGIGREIAITLAGYGAKVIVNYNGSETAANEVVATIRENSGEAVAVKANVAVENECKEMIENALATYGRVDILVNNAGVTRDNLLMKISEEDFDMVMDTNVKGSFFTIKHMYKAFLKQRSGRIINMSSVTGLSGNAGQGNYAASKAAVVGLTKSMAKELASRGVTVNAVAPGFIATDMTAQMTDTAKEAVLGQIPLKRVGEVSDIAECVAFLASDKASYITGQVISVDGGLHM